MPLQSDNLTMVALGVLNDTPPIQEQPVLVDGIHLRWMFPRAKGFPWHGYYLFRRVHELRGERCIGDDLTLLPIGSLGQKSLAISIGRLSSDVDLIATDDFTASGAAELDLAQRSWLRVDLSRDDLAYRVDIKIGCRGENGQKFANVDLSSLGAGPVSNPLHIDDLKFHLASSRKHPPKSLNFVAEGKLRAQRIPGGIELDGKMEVNAQELIRIVEVNATLYEGTATLQAINEDGVVVASVRFQKQKDPKPQQVRLIADSEFSQSRIVVRGGRLVIHRFSYTRSSKEEVKIDITALDGDVVVASATARGAAGSIIPITLQADRITAIRLSGGPAALIDLCIRPINLGLYDGWECALNR